MAIVTIVSNRRAGGQLPRRCGLHRIRRILAPGYRDLVDELRAIDALSTGELRAKFAQVFGYSTASHNRTYLRRKIKYRVQELSVGGLSDRALARAAELAAAGRLHHGNSGPRPPPRASEATNVPAERPARPAPNTVLRRTFGGADHEVTVLADGTFQYAGRAYRSLSTIAKEITGTVWNGKLFFGLVARGKKRSA